MNGWKSIKNVVALGGLLWLLTLIFTHVLVAIPFLRGQILIQDILYFFFWGLFSWLVISIYFSYPGTHIKDGTILAGAFILVNLFLDLVITIPMFGLNYNAFFRNYQVWVSYIEILVIGLLVRGSTFFKEFFRAE